MCVSSSVLPFAINLLTLSLVDSHHKYDDLLINYLIDQPVAAAAQLDFVEIGLAMQSVSFNARTDQDFRKLLLELLT